MMVVQALVVFGVGVGVVLCWWWCRCWCWRRLRQQLLWWGLQVGFAIWNSVAFGLGGDGIGCGGGGAVRRLFGGGGRPRWSAHMPGVDWI